MSKDKTEKKLVKPEEVILWVPGDLTIDSIGLGWDNIAMRGYSYNYLDVDIPAMRDYMIVNYKSNNLEMKRRENNSWKSKCVNPMMCAEKTGGFNLVNYRHSSGVYHEQETEDLHRRI